MIQAMAQSFGAELRRIDLRDASEVERAVSAFAHSPNAGLIVAVSAASLTHRDLIIGLAAQRKFRRQDNVVRSIFEMGKPRRES